MGCYFEHCGHKFECDGGCWTPIISFLYILMTITSFLDDVGCIVWMDSRDIRYKECVKHFLMNGSVD